MRKTLLAALLGFLIVGCTKRTDTTIIDSGRTNTEVSPGVGNVPGATASTPTPSAGNTSNGMNNGTGTAPATPTPTANGTDTAHYTKQNTAK